MNQFCNYLSKNQKLGILILCMTSLGLNYCFKSSRHTFNQVLTHLWWNFIPHLCHSLPNLPNSFRHCWILPQPSFDMLPQMFNGVYVWRLWSPVQNIDIIVFKPFGGLFGGVLGVIILLILVSSDQIILFQSSTVQFWYFKVKAKRFLQCTAESSGFFFFVTAFNECCLRTWCTVCEETGLGMMELMCFVAWTALATFPVVICVMIAHSEVAESLEGWPEWGDWWLGRRFWRTLATVGWLTPREEAILQVDWPLLARAMMFSFWAEEIECMGELKSIEWVGSA